MANTEKLGLARPDGSALPDISALNGNMDIVDANLGYLFIRKTYSYDYSNLAAGSNLSISANDFEVSTPSGYTPAGIVYYHTGNGNVYAYTVSSSATGTSSMMRIHNNAGSSAVSNTATITILYIKTTTKGTES